MKTIVLKFHDGTGPWASATDKAIRIVSDLTHVEALFEDGLSFSSTSREDLGSDAGGGVRFKAIGYSHPERWKDIVLPVTRDEYTRIRFRCDCMAALKIPYDMRGAIGCTITGRQDPDKYFCSEVLFDAILIEWLPAALNHKMHPRKLYQIAEILATLLLERTYRTLLSACADKQGGEK